MPARRGAWAIYEVFRLADGELFIGVTSDQQWTRFVEEFGLQAVAADPRLATNLMRNKERAWLIPILKEALGKLPQAEVAQRCERANVSWAPVGAAGRPVRRRAPDGQPADCWTSSSRPPAAARAARSACRHCRSSSAAAQRPGLRCQPPRMGEHNAQVLGEAGFSPAEIAALAERRVIVAAA